MTLVQTIRVMNRLATIHGRSLASYLTYASPTWHRNDETARQTLADITAQQRESADRLGEWIVDHNGVVDPGSYPMEFTGYHDLAFDFLLGKLVDHQKQDVQSIEACAEQVDEPMARELALECLGEAKAHLQSLQELRQEASA